MTENDIAQILLEKYNNGEFKYDIKTNQKFIEIVNASFESSIGYIVYHNHHVTDDQWYEDNYRPLLGKQIDKIIKYLKKDPDTRQAYIGMLNPKTFHKRNSDKICTIGMQVIYNQKTKTVDYIVNMRSNNVCEYTHDSLWQAKVFEDIVNRMRKEIDKDIVQGKLYWNVGSLHIYEEDFKFLLANKSFKEIFDYALQLKK